LAYQAVRNLVTECYREAVHYAVQAIMIAGAIALGLVLCKVFSHNIRNFKVKSCAIIMKRKKRLFRETRCNKEKVVKETFSLGRRKNIARTLLQVTAGEIR
ncbi:hypothetical protein B1144_00080, partial [Enterococcus faecium]